MAVPVIAQKSPFSVDVVAGRTSLRCSKRRPETVWFCGCKNTSATLCGGTHETLAI
jgi:hypothetical protein